MQQRYFYLFIIAFLLQACTALITSMPTDVTDEPVSQSPTQTETAVGTIPPVTVEVVDANTVTHIDVPTEGVSDRATAHDHDSALSFEKKVVRSGDEFFRNRFERPFTATEMEYLPDVDIVNFSITSDEIFFYIRISLVGLDPQTQSLGGSYGVEIDRNGDGRAEILLVAYGPYSEEFSPDNISVYLDMNSDIGGIKINRPDDFKSDGFETTIYDLSENVYPQDDPDLAWVRETTDGSLPAIEIAYKKWIFGDGKKAFMWSVDASGSPIDPSKLYIHDFITAEAAGAANNEDPNYPIKSVAEFDNTCRVPTGFFATGNEPLGCFIKSGETEKSSEPTNEGESATCVQYEELCTRVEDITVSSEQEE